MTELPEHDTVKRLGEVAKRDTPIVGGKGASLGEMMQASLPVPPGFVVLPEAFDTNGKLREKRAVLEAFAELDAPRVAVRSSATAEDAEKTSWAGQLDTYLNVTQDTLVDRIEACQRSSASERASAYARQHQLKDAGGVAVVVQAMVDSDIAGVMFTVSPISHSSDELIIEACYGLGELLVQGEVTPETITVSKKSGHVTARNDHAQKTYVKWMDGDIRSIPLGPEKQDRPILTDAQIAALTELGKTVEQHYGSPQDIEWAIKDDKIWLLQARPITTL